MLRVKPYPPMPTRLAEARKSAGLSQRGLGLAMGLDPAVASPRINQYERGKREPNWATLKLMADTLGIPLAYFFCDDPDTARLMLSLHALHSDQRRYYAKELLTLMEQIEYRPGRAVRARGQAPAKD